MSERWADVLITLGWLAFWAFVLWLASEQRT